MKPFYYTLVLLALGVSTATRAQKAHDPHAFLTVWETTPLDKSITIPTAGGGYDYTIDWGDGTVEHHQTGDATHQYATPGRQTVAITGKFPRIYLYLFFGTIPPSTSREKAKMANAAKIREVKQWGAIKWTSMHEAFVLCSHLEITASDKPDLSAVKDMSYMFSHATSFNQDISGWNVSNVTNMEGMFIGASSFDQPLNRWNVSKVTNMERMFDIATSFNQPLNSWNVSNVTNMEEMFSGARAFNHPLDRWNVSNVTNMKNMFWYANAFNQPLNRWNVSKVENMDGMFSSAYAFDQPLGSWNVSNVTNMKNMFRRADSFNQPLGSWNVSKVEKMNGMFWGAASFDQPLNSWNVSKVTAMDIMFSGANAFNQPLGSWNVSKVENMSGMFSWATSFNFPLDSWNVSNVKDMSSMFYEASSFNQDISGWNVSNVKNMSEMFGGNFSPNIDLSGILAKNPELASVIHMFSGTTMVFSAENYTRLLIGWAQRKGLQSGVGFGAPPNGYYCRAAAAREQLTDTYGWVITDDKGAIGLALGVPPPGNNDPSFKSSPRLTTPPPVSAPLITPPPFSQNAIHEVGKFEATDADGHELTLKLVAKGYNPTDYGFSLDMIRNPKGDTIAATLRWDNHCRKFPALYAKQDFELSVELEDKDICRKDNKKIIPYRLKTNKNKKPTITTTLPGNKFEVEAYQPAKTFTLTATDAEGDPILLRGVGKTTDFSTLGVTFPDQTNDGSVSSDFTFDASCRNLKRLNIKGDTNYPLQFIAQNQGQCANPDPVTLDVVLAIKVPPNEKPTITTSLPGNKFEVEAYQPAKTFTITATDAEGDPILLRGVGKTTDFRTLGVTFPDKTAKRQVSAPFTFDASCADLTRLNIKGDTNYPLQFIAQNQGQCANPDPVTLDVVLAIKVPPNEKPTIATTLPGNKFEVEAYQPAKTFIITATDAEGDPILLQGVGKTATLSTLGVTFPDQTNDGSVSSDFTFDASCRNLKRLNIKGDTNYPLQFIAQNQGQCANPDPVTLDVVLAIKVPPNEKPTIATTLPGNKFEVEAYQPAKTFTITATDAEGDPILLQGVGKTTDFRTLGVTFPDQTNDGSVSSDFTFDASCRNLKRLNIKGDTNYPLQFIAQNQGQCANPDPVTLDVVLAIKVPPNQAPTFRSLAQTHDVDIRDEPFTMRLTAEDADADWVSLSLLPGATLPPSSTLHFPRTKGKGEATATLTWQPECSLLGEGFAPKVHTVRFLAKDHHCMAPRADTLALTFNVKQEVTTTFHPENAFSPNGDGINDTFKLHGHQDPAYNLPKDCRHGAFRSILMINRSGQKLYRSFDRNFEWDGEGVKTGVYYYHIEYEHQSYQGVLHVFR